MACRAADVTASHRSKSVQRGTAMRSGQLRASSDPPIVSFEVADYHGQSGPKFREWMFARMALQTAYMEGKAFVDAVRADEDGAVLRYVKARL